MIKFKIGKVDLEIDGYAYEVLHPKFRHLNSPVASPMVHSMINFTFQFHRGKCGETVPTTVYEGLLLGPKINFVPKGDRYEGWKFHDGNPKKERVKPNSKYKSLGIEARLKKKSNEFIKSTDLTEPKAQERLNKLLPQWRAKVPKTMLKPLEKKYKYRLFATIHNLVAIGTASGPGFKNYFELVYPRRADWQVKKIKFCEDEDAWTNPYKLPPVPYPDPSKLPKDFDPRPDYKEVEIEEESPLQKKLEKDQEKFIKAVDYYFKTPEGVDEFRKWFRKK